MSDSDVKCDLEIKCNDNVEGNGIREVIEKVIEKVENMTCSKPIDIDPNYPRASRYKSGHPHHLKWGAERSKHRSGNRKNRVRHRKHKWKPYHKLTGDERRRLEERISRRAYRAREKMSASGLTLAPYNTTQFLMDDHNFGEPDYDSIHHESKSKDDYNSSEDYYSSPDDEEEFIQQQFSETYDSVHDDYINGMSKFELVHELIRLEDEVENLEQSLRESWEEKKSELDVDAEIEKIQVFQIEIEKLTHENHILEKTNDKLQTKLSQINAK